MNLPTAAALAVGLALATLTAACGSSAAPTSLAPAATPGGGLINVCAPQSSSPAGPVNDPNGPFFHQVAFATSDDGKTLGVPQQILDHASVPDGARLPDGGVGIYYVNGADGGVWLARLAGSVAMPIGPISINGVIRPAGVVDPDATLLPSGRVRLVYLQNVGGSSPSHAICVAESADGMEFQSTGTAVSLSASSTDTDPSVTQLRNGSWLMAISRGQQTVLARSTDGLAFVLGEILAFGGVPEVTTLDDGRVRLYVCAAGIESYISSDSGASWQREGVVVPARTLGHNIVCDPSRVAGTNLFVFKTGS